jgi:hypothetical protein
LIYGLAGAPGVSRGVLELARMSPDPSSDAAPAQAAPPHAKRWIAEYRLESDLVLAADEPELLYVHPSGLYQLRINTVSDTGFPDERLGLHIIAEAPDLETAATDLTAHVERFLQVLSFVTSTGYRIARQLYVVDWSPGPAMRECFISTSLRSTSPLGLSLPA